MHVTSIWSYSEIHGLKLCRILGGREAITTIHVSNGHVVVTFGASSLRDEQNNSVGTAPFRGLLGDNTLTKHKAEETQLPWENIKQIAARQMGSQHAVMTIEHC